MCKIVLVAIGNEVLRGFTLNTNSHFMARACHDAGFEVVEQLCVPDQPNSIREAIEQGWKKADVVISTGGLGPTVDDITASVAQSFSSAYIHFENHVGSALGMGVSRGIKEWLLLPGVPTEMRSMFKESILPHLQKKCPDVKPHHQYEVHIMSKGENEIEPHVCHLEGVGLYPAYGYVTVRFSDPSGVQVLQKAFGDLIYESCDGTLEQAVHSVIGKNTLAIAESCTGGFIAQKITSLSGASQFFKGGVVSYSNEMKKELLGVSEKTLEQYGAVSEEVAKEMVLGMAKRAKCDYAIAVTGIAGPDGGSKEKPVGTVYGALYAKGEVEVLLVPICNRNLRQIIIEVSANVMLGALYRRIKWDMN